MPKATLSFKLPEESNEHKLALDGAKYLYVLQDIDRWLRSQVKHNGELSEDKRMMLQEVRDLLRAACLEEGVEFDL